MLGSQRGNKLSRIPSQKAGEYRALVAVASDNLTDAIEDIARQIEDHLLLTPLDDDEVELTFMWVAAQNWISNTISHLEHDDVVTAILAGLHTHTHQPCDQTRLALWLDAAYVAVDTRYMPYLITILHSADLVDMHYAVAGVIHQMPTAAAEMALFALSRNLDQPLSIVRPSYAEALLRVVAHIGTAHARAVVERHANANSPHADFAARALQHWHWQASTYFQFL